MPTFEIKQVFVPLFGVVEAPDQSAWLQAFAGATTTTRVRVDAATLDFLANELELDAEGLATDAERYVDGKYRVKARGMGGSQLGDLGEILTFLVSRAQGQEIIRVVSWRAGSGQAIKGSRFPQPDFITKDASGLAALEVKSTEAFDFVELRDTKKRWMWLQPCSSVRGCREQALPQLAFVGGTLTPQQHSLVVQGGTIVPFPIGKGVASAVIAVDGRTNTLRGDPKYKTPKVCRQASRNCWSCLPTTSHFVHVTMPNSPGALSLGGAAGEDAPSWFQAYSRWSQALSACDLFAVRSSLRPLVETVVSWLGGMHGREANVLRNFWGSYLHDAMRSRGFNVEIPGQLGDLGDADLGFEWTPAPVAEPISRETSVDDISRLVAQDQASADPFRVSARYRQNVQDEDTVSIRSSGDFMEFHLVSETWWTQRSVETLESASSIAARLLSFALEASGWTGPTEVPAVPLRELVAYVGDYAVRLGWEAKRATPRSAAGRSWLRHWPFWFDFEPWPPWPTLLALGDPRVRLRVTPDGRAVLRMPGTVLRPT